MNSVPEARYVIEERAARPRTGAWRRISEHIEREQAIGAAAVLAYASPERFGPRGGRRLRVRALTAGTPARRAIDDPVQLARAARIVRQALARAGWSL